MPSKQNAPVVRQVKRSTAKRGKVAEPEPTVMYKCARCGAEYDKQQGNFSRTRSPMWANGSGGYLPVCHNCTNELYHHYEEALGSREKALERMCMKFDIYWSPRVYKMMFGAVAQENQFKSYVTKTMLQHVRHESYDDTLDDDAVDNGDLVLPKEELQKAHDLGETQITPEDIERWGGGYTKEEYRMMDAHYRMLTAGETNIEFLRDKYIRDMCNIHVQSVRAMANKDTKGYADLLTLYQKVAQTAQIKVQNTDIDTSNDTYGKWLAEIEKYTPAEYYADKKRYRDFFGIQEYCERFIYRPLKNLITGSKDKDKEFNLDEDG